ncbi:MAG: MBL fold metallo-hydrolase [Candidatus Gastranaerophilaceae bacterium]|jgi:glyoxylase-like metal-dependent hydrolase (beta-lactamase superfamily II)
MIIKTLSMGVFQVNNYLVIDEESKQAVLIDAGGDYDMVMAAAKEYKVEIKYILNTHGHMDHIAGDEEIQRKNKVKVFMHKQDKYLLDTFTQHLSAVGMPLYETPVIDEYVEDSQEITLGNLKFKVIHTPGHTPGCVGYLIDNVLFSGDTLFANSVGRTDLPGGNYNVLEKSIKEKIYSLDEDVIVYPGHGNSTTVKTEKNTNPYFSMQDTEKF